MSDGTELELKLETDTDGLEALAASPILAEAALSGRDQMSTYYDTPDLLLREAGFTLRIRKSGDRMVQTIKAEDAAASGLFARPEWERDVPDERPIIDAASGPLADVVSDPANALTPLFTVAVHRQSATVSHEDAIVEIVLDHGIVTATSRKDEIAEAELELKDGSPAALFSLARALGAVAPLRLGVRSKSDRGYVLNAGKKRDKAVKAEAGVLRGEMTAGEAFARIAAACIRQFRLNEALLIRTRRADALHQARVAIRRLRSACSTFKPIVADARFEALRAELRWLAATLGEARDLDVLLDRSEGKTADLLRETRERTYDAVLTALDSQRTRGLMLDLAEWIAIGQWRAGSEHAALRDGPAKTFAADALDRLRRRIKRRGKRLVSQSDEQRHDVRILAKKLRYASEFFSGLFTGRKADRRARAFLAALERLQEKLGDLNDLAHGPHVLARLGIDGEALPIASGDRHRLISDAAEAWDALIDAKRFWR